MRVGDPVATSGRAWDRERETPHVVHPEDGAEWDVRTFLDISIAADEEYPVARFVIGLNEVVIVLDEELLCRVRVGELD